MILLIGPPNWEAQMLHYLGDRTSHAGNSKMETRILTTASLRSLQGLRGINEWVEVVSCNGGYELTWTQKDLIEVVEHLNGKWLERQAQTYLDKQSRKR